MAHRHCRSEDPLDVQSQLRFLLYWITQHLHLGFFLIITCSTVDESDGGTTMPCWTCDGKGSKNKISTLQNETRALIVKRNLFMTSVPIIMSDVTNVTVPCLF